MKIFMIVTRVEIFGIYIQNSYKQVMKIFMIATRVEILEVNEFPKKQHIPILFIIILVVCLM